MKAVATPRPASSGHRPQLTVCVCTYRRPEMLRALLEHLLRQETADAFSFSVSVADNDPGRSAEAVVKEFQGTGAPVAVSYAHESRRNIAHARNRSLAAARGEFIAFIDDDEVPCPDWLLRLVEACAEEGVDGVLGPVVPRFVQPPPAWAVRGAFFERPRHATGWEIGLSDARTGNVLFRSGMLDPDRPAFDPRFGEGGEDVDFFRRMMAQGRRFTWCDEAEVFEAVPPERCSRRYLLRRALLRGHLATRQSSGRAFKLLKSLLAVPIYGALLPFLWLSGGQRGLRYTIKFCDHAGRLLAMIGMNPVRERDASAPSPALG